MRTVVLLILLIPIAQTRALAAQDPLTSMQSHCIKLSRLIPDIKLGTVMVTCQKELVEWRGVSEEAAPIKNSTTWLAGMTNIFFSVPLQSIQQQQEPFRCQRLEKWRGQITANLELACSDLLDIRDLPAFCEEQITSTGMASDVKWDSTGEFFSTCGSASQPKPQGRE